MDASFFFSFCFCVWVVGDALACMHVSDLRLLRMRLPGYFPPPLFLSLSLSCVSFLFFFLFLFFLFDSSPTALARCGHQPHIWLAASGGSWILTG